MGECGGRARCSVQLVAAGTAPRARGNNICDACTLFFFKLTFYVFCS